MKCSNCLTTISRALASRGRKHMATAYWPGSGRVTPVSLAHSRNSAIGNLDQDAGAIAHQRVGAHRAAMVEIDQELQALADDVMGFLRL